MTTKKAAKTTKTAKPLVTQQPQSKAAAAQDAGVFLKTDDSWSNAYWTDGDLHFEERELFG